ncbi:MAG: hypothetical protein H6704_02095 [Myxococcales bacterium]|nr:hypothetical protein [Myxococcales bacterium]
MRAARPLAGLIALLGCLGAAHGAELFPIAPTLDARHADEVRPALAAADARLRAIVAGVAAKGVPLKVVTTGAYGSWFVPLVERGGDLDVLGLIDIGALTADRAGAEAAVGRVEALLRGLRAEKGKATTDLAVLDVDGLDAGGQLEDRRRAVAQVAAMLAGVPAKKGTDLAFPYRGRQAPYHFAPGRVSLTVHPRAKCISDRFAVDAAVASPVREVSIQFFFVGHVGDHPVVLEPLYVRGASPIRIWRFVFETVFATPADRAAFAAVAGADLDLDLRRAEYGAFILSVAGAEIEGGRAMKAAKRLLQSFAVAEAALPADTAAAFRAEVGPWLRGPAATLDDLGAVASIFRKAAHVGVEGALRDAGTVKAVLAGYRARLARLKAPGVDALPGRIDAVLKAGPVDRAAAWQALEDAAEAAAKAVGPPPERLLHWAQVLDDAWRGAGVYMVPVHGLVDGAVVVPAAAVDHLRLKPSRVTWPGAWPLRVAPTPAEPPVRHLFVQSSTGPSDAAGWAAMLRAFAAQKPRFALPGGG